MVGRNQTMSDTHLMTDNEARRPQGSRLVADGTSPPSPRRRIRVVHCLDNFGVGGTELNAVRTLELLDRERYDVSLACLTDDGPLRARYEAAGIPVERFPLRNLYGSDARRTGRRFANYLRREGADIVHCHDCYSNIFGTFWARAARVGAIITSRRWLDAFPSRLHRAGNFVAYHASTVVLANSAAVAALVRSSERVPASRVVTVTNFVDDNAFATVPEEDGRKLRASLGVPSGALVVGIVANLRPVKDIGTLVRAIAGIAGRWPALHLVVIGTGARRQDLVALAAESGIADRVHFPGYLANDPNLHQLFDVSVLCSVREGFPNTLVEAMAAGRPIVATSVGGIPDAVRDGDNGLLVPPSDPRALGAALERLLGDPALRARLGSAGRERAEREFRTAHVIPRLERVYDRLAGDSVHRSSR